MGIDNFAVHVQEVKSFMRKRELQLQALGLRAKGHVEETPKSNNMMITDGAVGAAPGAEGPKPLTGTEVHVFTLQEIIQERQRFARILQSRCRERDEDLRQVDEEAHHLAIALQRALGRPYSEALVNAS